MPAPIIAGAAVTGGRVVGGTITKTSRAGSRPRSTIAQNRSLRAENARPQAARQSLDRNKFNPLLSRPDAKKKQGLAKKLAKKAFLVARMISVNTTLAFLLVGLYVSQVVGGVFFLYGTYVDQSFWLDLFLPGEEAWQMGWALGTLSGLLALLLVLLSYTVFRIPILKGLAPLITLIIFAAIFVPYTLLIPWVFIWLLAIFFINGSSGE